MIHMRDNIFCEGPEEIIDALKNAFNRTDNINKNSKYHSNQRVKISQDIQGIVTALSPAYTYHEALGIAHIIAGQKAAIISPDILEDDKGNLGTYYTLEVDTYPGFFVLPEHLVEDIK